MYYIVKPIPAKKDDNVETAKEKSRICLGFDRES